MTCTDRDQAHVNAEALRELRRVLDLFPGCPPADVVAAVRVRLDRAFCLACEKKL